MGRFGYMMLCASVLIGTSSDVRARVVQTTLADLIGESELIVMGKVAKVVAKQGERFATIHPESVITGSVTGPVRYLAQRRWTCDLTRGEVGQRAVFFFKPLAKGDPISQVYPGERVMEVVGSGRGMMTLVDIEGEPYATIRVNDVRLPLELETMPVPTIHDESLRAVKVSHLVAFIRRLRAVDSGSERSKRE